MVLPNDQQFLARPRVVARANIGHAAVADIETFDNRQAKGPRALNDAAAHAARIDQRLLTRAVFEWTIDCLKLPQEIG
jgi:hypothetical protein